MVENAPAAEKVLVVDDNEMNRDMLSRRLQRRGYDVVMAEDGYKALELIDQQPFHLVLLDIMMPGINGLEVLETVRQKLSATDLPIIMATAKDQSEDVVKALKLGANDYVTKPLDFPVVLARVQTQLALKHAVDKIVELERSLTRRNEELDAANQRMSNDLKAAAKIQEALLPSALPSVAGIEFQWSFRPCDELAGDILNIFQLDDEHLGMYVLDVSGHGVASSLLSVTVSRFLSPQAHASSLLLRRSESTGEYRAVPPAQVAAQLNERFPWDTQTGQFFTMIYGILHVPSGEFRFVSAGHPPLVYLPADGPLSFLDISGFPIGIAECEYEEHTLTLRPGDRIFLYSDGVPEAMSAADELFGNDRLRNSLQSAASQPLADCVAHLVGDLTQWTGGRFHDDISIVAAGVQ